MTVVNIEKLAGCKVIVMTGRERHIMAVAPFIVRNQVDDITCYPGVDDYFQDYPDIVEDLRLGLESKDGSAVVITQSAEFLDCLLESKLAFVLATVRACPDGVYRLRVLTKDEALENRRNFNMELRV